jgi:hypothetical protein
VPIRFFFPIDASAYLKALGILALLSCVRTATRIGYTGWFPQPQTQSWQV